MPVISYHFTSISSARLHSVLLMWMLTSEQNSMHESAFNCSSVSCHTILTKKPLSIEYILIRKSFKIYPVLKCMSSIQIQVCQISKAQKPLEPRFSLPVQHWVLNCPYSSHHSCRSECVFHWLVWRFIYEFISYILNHGVNIVKVFWMHLKGNSKMKLVKFPVHDHCCLMVKLKLINNQQTLKVYRQPRWIDLNCKN